MKKDILNLLNQNYDLIDRIQQTSQQELDEIKQNLIDWVDNVYATKEIREYEKLLDFASSCRCSASKNPGTLTQFKLDALNKHLFYQLLNKNSLNKTIVVHAERQVGVSTALAVFCYYLIKTNFCNKILYCGFKKQAYVSFVKKIMYLRKPLPSPVENNVKFYDPKSNQGRGTYDLVIVDCANYLDVNIDKIIEDNPNATVVVINSYEIMPNDIKSTENEFVYCRCHSCNFNDGLIWLKNDANGRLDIQYEEQFTFESINNMLIKGFKTHSPAIDKEAELRKQYLGN